MAQAHVKTVTSREFVHNVSAARRAASEGGTVIITKRGEPALALIPIAEYRRLTGIELPRMPEAEPVETIRMNARDIDA